MAYRREVGTRHEVGQDVVKERSGTISVVSAGMKLFKLEQDAGYGNEYFRVKGRTQKAWCFDANTQ